MSEAEASRAALPPYVRSVAAVGAVAFILGRAIAPALRGAGQGLDRVIAYADVAGAFVTYLFAFAGIAAAILQLMLTFRETRLHSSYRTVATILAVCVISLVAPAFREPLPERASIVAALASGILALLASSEVIGVPRTRALGVLLVATGVAALLHLGASLSAWYAGERALYRMATFASVLATLSVFFDTLSLLVAFAWLSLRGQRSAAWGARIALFIGFFLAYGAFRSGGRETSQVWELVTYRAVDRLLSVPDPYVWQPYRVVLETCAPLLAVAALAARGQMPAISGAFALALLARPTTDVPLSALALTLASLSAPLAARDDRGMWAVLMANSRPDEPLGEPVERRNS